MCLSIVRKSLPNVFQLGRTFENRLRVSTRCFQELKMSANECSMRRERGRCENLPHVFSSRNYIERDWKPLRRSPIKIKLHSFCRHERA